MENYFGKNIRYLRKKNNMGQEVLADKLGYKSFTTIQKWESGDSEPTLKKLNELGTIFDVNINDLVTKDLEQHDIPGLIPLNKVRRIPIIGRIACGEPIFAEENYEGYFVSDPNMLSADFALYARGDSMINANIKDGDLVFFRKTPQVENGSIAAVLIDDEATLKRFKKIEDMIILEPENNEYKPIIITEEDNKNVTILGEMVGVYSIRNK